MSAGQKNMFNEMLKTRHAEKLRQFDAVMQNRGKFLESVIWRLTGNRELFAEAWQNTLLGVWQHIEKLDGSGSGSYLYRIALSSVSKEWKSRVGESSEFEDVEPANCKGPDEAASDAELLASARKAIAELGFQQGRAIVMRYLECKEYQQLAQELGCSEAAARSHVSKAIATLRESLNGLFDKELCNEKWKT
jgi:RNA polymerase sigma factor (sigma-70 family)